jgi:hypothetical protein
MSTLADDARRHAAATPRDRAAGTCRVVAAAIFLSAPPPAPARGIGRLAGRSPAGFPFE